MGKIKSTKGDVKEEKKRYFLCEYCGLAPEKKPRVFYTEEGLENFLKQVRRINEQLKNNTRVEDVDAIIEAYLKVGINVKPEDVDMAVGDLRDLFQPLFEQLHPADRVEVLIGKRFGILFIQKGDIRQFLSGISRNERQLVSYLFRRYPARTQRSDGGEEFPREADAADVFVIDQRIVVFANNAV